MMYCTMRLAAIAGLVLGLSGPLAAQPREMPPTPVSVMQVKTEELPVINELPGRISSTRISEVLPRVSGILEERVFTQGSFVHQGDLLYRIDPAPFAVKVKAGEASLARANATLSSAKVELNRQEELRQRKVTAAVELERAETVVLQAEADVAIAEAALDEARLNLAYTEVRAPISGTIGRALVTEGALVSSNGPHLALIQQLDPVYADFTQSTAELFRLRRALDAGELVATAADEATVQLLFDDGSVYEHRGRLLFSEAAVDESTGQVTLRGEFPNPDDRLLPGLYVRGRIEQAINKHAIAIPQKAVLRDGHGKAQVYVVAEENKAELRPVELGATLNSRWLVQSGLEPGDTVVVEGAQKLYPGATVAPEPATDDAAAQPAAVGGSPVEGGPAGMAAADGGAEEASPVGADAKVAPAAGAGAATDGTDGTQAHAETVPDGN